MEAVFGGMRVPDMQPEALPAVDGPGGLYSDGNPQTDLLIEALGVSHVWTRPFGAEKGGRAQGPPYAPEPPTVKPPASWLEPAPSGECEGLAVNSAGSIGHASDPNEISIDGADECSAQCVNDVNEIDIDEI